MGKSYFLSEKDYQEFGKLDPDIMEKMPKHKLAKLYRLLEERYNLNSASINFPINPYFIESLITSDENDPINDSLAANVYIRVMEILCNLESKKGNTNLREKFIKYLEKNIKVNEKMERSKHGLEYSMARHSLATFLLLLDKQYRKNNDKNEYMKTTYKIYKHHFKKEDYKGPYKSSEMQNALAFTVRHPIYDDFFRDNLFDLNKEDFFFGDNEKLLESYSSALITSDDPYPILILGETGTGKEKLARRIHDVSLRKDNSFQVLNCAAIPETLFDSEISGIIKGTATNVSTRLGVFLAACHKNENGYRIKDKGKIFFHNKKWEYEPTEPELREVGGTVFLDEINSIPTFLQAKLLRIIEENEVRVVGEERSRKFNVKLICASNTDLYNEVREGVFREDLYHRISGHILRLPSLSEMKESLIEIAQHKLSEIVKEIGYKKNVKLSKAAGNKIQNYDWPGNFRELNNILYRALNEIRLEGKNIINGSQIIFPSSFNQPIKTIDNFLPDIQFEDLEKRYIIAIMKKAGGNETKAAKMAGFGNSRTRLQTRLKKYGLKFKK
jgi:DNA-binding NtrC family response regulator